MCDFSAVMLSRKNGFSISEPHTRQSAIRPACRPDNLVFPRHERHCLGACLHSDDELCRFWRICPGGRHDVAAGGIHHGDGVGASQPSGAGRIACCGNQHRPCRPGGGSCIGPSDADGCSLGAGGARSVQHPAVAGSDVAICRDYRLDRFDEPAAASAKRRARRLFYRICFQSDGRQHHRHSGQFYSRGGAVGCLAWGAAVSDADLFSDVTDRRSQTSIRQISLAVRSGLRPADLHDRRSA